ncbi:MAG: GDSL family lipase [Novosphingobium sp.]|nr:GDSL family lipase [Novosphingobium sp.]MBP6554621.1 GDSL family lipase [Novosphingobium sp.]
MIRWLLAAIALAFAAPAMAAEPVNSYPPPGMMENACPASRDGLWALDPKVLQSDWAWQCRYRADNAKVDPANPPQVVFIGDSITENWVQLDPGLFGQTRLGRGISGQTSPQLLVRFWQDVVSLRPKVVHIMVGTNDIAGNTGPTTPEAYKNAIRAMVSLAQANGIVVILGSIPPADQFGWATQHRPASWIAGLNLWLKSYADERGAIYADYFTPLAGPNSELRPEYGPDGVHPNAAGYAVMRPVAEKAIVAAESLAAITQ